MSRYEPLSQFLAVKSVRSLRISFREIEKVLGFKLPKCAYVHKAWWSNNGSGHSHAVWMRSGWRTGEVDLNARKVTFEQATSASEPKQDPFGCMAGTITFLPGVDLTAPSDDKWNAERGLLLNE